MSATPYAKILVSVNGAPNVSGGLDVPSAAVLTLTPESIDGWGRAVWEFYDYPEGWSTPSGWTLGSGGIIFYAGYTPPSITLPANTELWGVWMLRLRVNEQADDDKNRIGNLLDDSTSLSMLSPRGLRSIGARERFQFTTPTTRVKAWLRSLQRTIHAIDLQLSAGDVGVVPGAAGNVLRSNGSAWQSAPIVAGDNGDLQLRNGNVLAGLSGANNTVVRRVGGVWVADPGVEVPAGTENELVALDGSGGLKSRGLLVPSGNANSVVGLTGSGGLKDLGLFAPTVIGHRLSVSDTQSVPTGVVSNANTLYIVPHEHAYVSLYDGERWALRTFDLQAIDLTSVLAGIYDVFLVWNGSYVAPELSDAWTNATTRANGLARQNGIVVKSGAPTRRHVATIWLTSTGQVQWTARQCGVWNRYNQVDLDLSVTDPTDSWAYTTAAWRAARNQATNSVQYVTGDPATMVVGHAHHSAQSSGSDVGVATGIGIDSTSTNSAIVFGGVAWSANPGTFTARYQGRPGLGQRTVNWLEYGGANVTFHGDRGVPIRVQNGMVVGYRG